MKLSPKTQRGISIVTILLMAAGCAVICINKFLVVSDFLFPLSWSESGRIFDASLIYSPLIYGKSYPWPMLDPGRAMLDGIALILPGTSIFLYRLWVVLLTVVSTGVTAWLVTRQFKQDTFWKTLLLTGLGFLFLFQGPIYYHVLIGAILVLALYDPQRPVRTLLVVLIASAWEGICRINWFPMPAVIATLLYVLKTPTDGMQFFSYFKHPIRWFITGISASAITCALYSLISGNPMPVLNSNFHYGFFTSRLWPNSGYAPGLVGGILLLTSPFLAVILFGVIRNLKRISWMRWTPLAALLAVFFAGSTLIAMRVGGGYDLHNYDTFLLITLIISFAIGTGNVAQDQETQKVLPSLFQKPVFLFLLLLIPLWSAVSKGITPLSTADSQRQKAGIQELQAVLSALPEDGRPVLFIDQRHLLVFGQIDGVDLYLPYEKIYLMEMAMAQNRPYLSQFHEKLANQEFSLIISEPLIEVINQDLDAPFAMENNEWVSEISWEILKYYEPVKNYPDLSMAIYQPK